MKKIYFLTLFLVFGLFPSIAKADVNKSTDLNIRIFPKDCVFDEIEVGGQRQFVFHTPEECGVPITPTESNDPENPELQKQSINIASLLQQTSDEETTRNLKNHLINEADYTISDKVVIKRVFLGWIFFAIWLLAFSFVLIIVYRRYIKNK